MVRMRAVQEVLGASIVTVSPSPAPYRARPIGDSGETAFSPPALEITTEAIAAYDKAYPPK